MSKNIHVERWEYDLETCHELESAWEALSARSSRPSIYSTFDYVCTACRHFQKGEEIFFLLFREKPNGRLLAIVPLSIWIAKCHGIAVRTIRQGITTAYTDVDKFYPIIDRDYEMDFWIWFRDYFHKEFRKWDIIEYDEFWPESYLCTGLKKLFPFPRYWTKTVPGSDSPIVKLDGEWDEFWMGHRKLRKKYRKLEKRLGENLSYVVTGDPADVGSCLDDYVATERLGWKAGLGVSQKENALFYRDLFSKMAAKNRLFFGMMYDRGKVVSIEIAYTLKDRVFFAHGTYNPAYADLSPGTVNSCRFIRFFHGKGFVEGDYLAGYAHYNNPWSCRIEKSVNIVIRRMGWRNWLLAAIHLWKKARRKFS